MEKLINGKIGQYIKSNKVLFLLFKPIANGIQFFSTMFKRIKNFMILRVFPFFRCKFSPDNRLEKLRNIYEGKRIFLIATGPSVQVEDLEKLSSEITIGVNGIIKEYKRSGWLPTYYCAGDPVVYELWGQDMNEAKPANVLFDYEYKKLVKDIDYDPIYFNGYKKGALCSFEKQGEYECMEINDDIVKKGVCRNGRSIITQALQIALYMGSKEIYLYGLDCNYSGAKQHYDDDETTERITINFDSRIAAMFSYFEVAKEYAEQNGIKIINVTRGGKLEIFERKDLDEVLADK